MRLNMQHKMRYSVNLARFSVYSGRRYLLRLFLSIGESRFLIFCLRVI